MVYLKIRNLRPRLVPSIMKNSKIDHLLGLRCCKKATDMGVPSPGTFAAPRDEDYCALVMRRQHVNTTSIFRERMFAASPAHRSDRKFQLKILGQAAQTLQIFRFTISRTHPDLRSKLDPCPVLDLRTVLVGCAYCVCASDRGSDLCSAVISIHKLI